jgi:hypothetical protein
MEKASFFGLILMLKANNLSSRLSIIKDNGGEDFLMDKESIRKIMVNKIIT